VYDDKCWNEVGILDVRGGGGSEGGKPWCLIKAGLSRITDEAVRRRFAFDVVVVLVVKVEAGFSGSLSRAWPSWAEWVNWVVCWAEMVCWGKIAEVGPVWTAKTGGCRGELVLELDHKVSSGRVDVGLIDSKTSLY
jgi:hypothetical protein